MSLLFVGWEIRQNTQVARGQTRTEPTALNNEFLARLGDPEFVEVWQRAWQEDENLSALDSYGFFGFREQFMAHPRFPRIWEPRRLSFDPKFVAFLEGPN